MKKIPNTQLFKLSKELEKIDFQYFCEEYNNQCWFCPIWKLCRFSEKLNYEKKVRIKALKEIDIL